MPCIAYYLKLDFSVQTVLISPRLIYKWIKLTKLDNIITKTDKKDKPPKKQIATSLFH